MGLSNDLISQFAKLTKSDKNTKTESTHNGTIVEYNGSKYVKLDGSDSLTPISTTADTKIGDRVTVMIKNHSATVTGNITSPSARTSDVQEIGAKTDETSSKITDVEILVADKVSTDELDAQVARIDELVADNIIIKEYIQAAGGSFGDLEADYVDIAKRLTAAEAIVDDLEVTKLDVEVANANFATISDLDATNADIYNLSVTYGEFENLSTRKFEAYDATINRLDATYAKVSDLSVERARIDVLQAASLTANSALIKDLQADIADIDTLIFGSASGTVVQTTFANSVIAQLGNAQIKSAMIESVAANKITAGDIITNNVHVKSEDGKLVISDETIQISDDSRVRVQIGKDASGDYSINIWDNSGNLMFSEGGITDNAIKQAIIRNDMISDTANISAHKLDIESLFEEINGSAQTIKSSKIFLDSKNQTLDVIFTDLTTDMASLEDTVSSQGTQLSVMQGEITSKVWEQDITAAIDTQYSYFNQTVNEFKTEVGNTYATKGDLSGVNNQVVANKSAIEQNTDDITLVVSKATNNEQAISTLQQTSSSLTSRIKTTEDGVKTNTSLINTAQTTADNAQTAAANAQNDIDNLEVGARNLARNTSNAIGYTVTTETGTDAYSICDSYFKQGILLEQGKTYTLSYNYEFDWGSVTKPTSAVGVGAGIGSDDGKNLPGSYFADTFSMVADYWTYGDGGYDSGRFVYTFTNNTTKDLYFAFRMIRSYKYEATTNITGVTITVSNFKVEIGNRATDWTPAPEDMATSDQLATIQSSAEMTEERLTTAETLIQQLTDSITMLVTDGAGGSLMVQTENGWTFSTGELQDMVNDTSENLNNLTNEMGDVNSSINALQQAVSDLGVLNDYVKIGTYENEPCIELGESDSDFKLLITNTRIMFMEGSGVPAYLNNQSLYIKKAVIEEELQQGEFIWKVRSNGNLGLIWKGATS